MSRTREKRVCFRLSEEEYEMLCDKVETSGLSQQTYIIRALLDKEILNVEPLKQMLPEMKRQGNNLNQIAKRLNERGYVDYKSELSNTLQEVQETWQSLRLFLHTHQ